MNLFGLHLNSFDGITFIIVNGALLGVLFFYKNINILTPESKVIKFLQQKLCSLGGFWTSIRSAVFAQLNRKKAVRHRILLLGDEEMVRELNQIIKRDFPHSHKIIDYWHEFEPNNRPPSLLNSVKVNKVNTIIYSTKSNISKEFSDILVNMKFNRRNKVYNVFHYYCKTTGKLPIYHMNNFEMLFTDQRELFLPRLREILKKTFDLVCVLIALPLVLPLIALSGLLIKIDSKGPIFHIQERLGKNGVPFSLIKLRSMVPNAEQVSGPCWARENDQRVTRVGRVLRKLRLDELPQIFNVLKGDMSLIGPRPIRKYFADLLEKDIPYYGLRFLLKPGLTGWAQVNHDYAGSKEGQSEKLQYDLYYLTHQSLWLDFVIIFKSIRVILAGNGL